MSGSRTKSLAIRWVKLVGSCCILFHLIAVAAAPASVPPAPATAGRVFACVEPYLQFTFLNHGYHFFAPDPGSSSLIEYTAVMENGDRIWGRIPDKSRHRPRLLYHRYFMLTEFLGSLPESQVELRQSVAGTYALPLLEQYGADKVELSYVVHELSTREEILAGRQLTDPSKYLVNQLGTYSLRSPTQSASSLSTTDP